MVSYAHFTYTGRCQKKLWLFERKILRKIFGRTEEVNGIWRIKPNKELDELIKHRNIINYLDDWLTVLHHSITFFITNLMNKLLVYLHIIH